MNANDKIFARLLKSFETGTYANELTELEKANEDLRETDPQRYQRLMDTAQDMLYNHAHKTLG